MKILPEISEFCSVFSYNVKETVEQIEAGAEFPDIPVYVITGGKENRMIQEIVQKKTDAASNGIALIVQVQ
ncbi:hypothetical protein [Paenibacillus riograndensis]|uniref:Uncharacterized protein n=1 Tax=Paenibacillus riograndensis SBR5 TaxID=1073571 RepID=A0A0E4CXA3_9BACL|nr:hypothetical protein [Paenibacillus riograndensis]CQR56157.1 hypothetical protein PRIO_3754 [Paenibacillus riograndensis SBR5]